VKPLNEPKMIRSFGLFVSILCGGIGAYLTLRSGQVRYVWFAVGVYFLAGAVLFQPILRPLFRVWMKLAAALGWFNTRLLLTLVYGLVFSPVALVQRLFGRDHLRLHRAAQDSFWTPKLQAADKASYFRQF
jgi:hypothetical protein